MEAGAVLLQTSEDGLKRPVSFSLDTFNVHKSAYSTVEKEALALVLALEHFELYVGGAARPKSMRWSLVLQSFSIIAREFVAATTMLQMPFPVPKVEH